MRCGVADVEEEASGPEVYGPEVYGPEVYGPAGVMPVLVAGVVEVEEGVDSSEVENGDASELRRTKRCSRESSQLFCRSWAPFVEPLSPHSKPAHGAHDSPG